MQRAGEPDPAEEKKGLKQLKVESDLAAKAAAQRALSRAEIREHNAAGGAWLVAGDRVYDAGPFLELHPAHTERVRLRVMNETDVERDLLFHNKKQQRLWAKYLIAHIEGSTEKQGCVIS